jgi:hypothetical protein
LVVVVVAEEAKLADHAGARLRELVRAVPQLCTVEQALLQGA